jgi:hypothetical protein
MCNSNKHHPFIWSKYDLAKRFALKNNYKTMAEKINSVLEAMK